MPLMRCNRSPCRGVCETGAGATCGTHAQKSVTFLSIPMEDYALAARVFENRRGMNAPGGHLKSQQNTDGTAGAGGVQAGGRGVQVATTAAVPVRGGPRVDTRHELGCTNRDVTGSQVAPDQVRIKLVPGPPRHVCSKLGRQLERALGDRDWRALWSAGRSGAGVWPRNATFARLTLCRARVDFQH
jgi:hypothetical protein